MAQCLQACLLVPRARCEHSYGHDDKQDVCTPTLRKPAARIRCQLPPCLACSSLADVHDEPDCAGPSTLPLGVGGTLFQLEEVLPNAASRTGKIKHCLCKNHPLIISYDLGAALVKGGTTHDTSIDRNGASPPLYNSRGF